MNSFDAVRRSAMTACATREPAQWESAVSDAFQQLQNEGTVTSWSVNSYRDGVIIRVTIPGQPSADLLVLPRSGRGPASV